MRQENTHGLVARKLLSWGVALSPFLALKKQLQGAFELPVFFFFLLQVGFLIGQLVFRFDRRDYRIF